ncbi:sulfurtransferase TusA family protein [Microtetraspora sp. NBRC 16547]|uniref:sulfurtransferase TusA family protein n=1 Tax=Microtetraspora sp. NBRC 16547 TaxID=3030993 RepID=UPI0024A53C06|nr:sulfurtransferase TusA family protein [Microtetraspora sp. NBRC 16547]GLW97161.1 hypothetical protein Misp02_12480 [Microtetraspora sp. NBRC 16547]
MWRRRSGAGRNETEEPRAESQAGAREPAALTIDALGRKCPIPIIMLADQINQVPMGAVVEVLADDPAAYTDVPAWCRLKSHAHVGSVELPQGGWSIQVRRNY